MKINNSLAIDQFILEDDLKIFKDYLHLRKNEKRPKRGLSIVFDITNSCNLACVGCCVNAKKYNGKNTNQGELSTDQVIEVLEKIQDYSEYYDYDEVYVNFGGGEPFLRKDFNSILKFTKKIIKNSVIAIDTNGTFLDIDNMNDIFPYISNLGVSIDGFGNHHDSWRKPKDEISSYSSIINSVINLLEYKKFESKLEITSVVTNSNIIELPKFAEYLFDIGIKKYSMHRAMPSGRMLNLTTDIPSALQYLVLSVEIAKVRSRTDMDVHMHHTLESIYSALFCGINTYKTTNMHKNPNEFSSIAIDHYGNVFIDPWATVEPWSKLVLGSILGDNSLLRLLSYENKKFRNVTKYFNKQIRCKGCKVECSGGSRLAAAANALSKKNYKTWLVDDILDSLVFQDPACPLTIPNIRGTV